MSAWLERLKPGGLPVFRHTRDALVAMLPRRESLTAREVAMEILEDPLATLLVVHAINEKVGQRYGTEVATVEHALMMQGIGAFLEAARALPVLEDTAAGRDPRALAAVQAIARRAQHAAWQARDFAVLHSDIRAEEVQVAALLHAAPELLLWLRAPEVARRLASRKRRLSAPEAESEVLGQALDTLRLPLLEAWSIPELSRDLLDERYAERNRQVILGACLDMADRAQRGWWDEGLHEDYIALAGVENTPMEVVIATAHANAARAARACEWLAAPAAAAWMPLEPGPWPEEEEDSPAGEETTVQPAPVSTSTPPVASPAAAAAPSAGDRVPPPAVGKQAVPEPAPDAGHTVCPMPDKQILRETLQGIEGHLDGSLTLNQMSAIVLKGLHSGLGLTRILFAMITPDGERVKSRFTLGIPAEDPMRHFEFRLDGKDLFAQLMGKMQGVWINEGNRERLWPMVDARLRTLIGAGDFYAMSLFNGSKPLGLIYADRGHGECGLDPLTYTDFKMLCLQAARGLGKVRN